MRLVVTRPEHDAAPLATRLRALGHEVLVEPVLTIVSRERPLSAPGPWRAIIFTSANGIRALTGAPELASLLAVPVLTVGSASAAAAREAGFASVTGAGGDLDSLADLIRATIPPGDGRLLYLTGQTVSGDLAGMLGHEGYDVVRKVLYDAVAAESLSDRLENRIRAGTIDGVLLFSKRTAQIWAEAALRGGLGPHLGTVRHFCLSQVIGDVISAMVVPPPPVAIAATPDTDALVGLLDR